MIEVEKKFSLTKEQEKNLTKDTKFFLKKEMIDVYYDNERYYLTKNDLWLRQRNNDFELKVSKNKNINRKADQYDEITEEDKIRDYLKIKKENDFSQDLKKSGYSIFAVLKTVRTKYKKDSFIIDIDEITSDQYSYSLAEIELMVEENSDIDDAIKKIIDFAKSKGLQIGIYTRGKVVEYIKQKRPEHFNALLEANIVK